MLPLYVNFNFSILIKFRLRSPIDGLLLSGVRSIRFVGDHAARFEGSGSDYVLKWTELFLLQFDTCKINAAEFSEQPEPDQQEPDAVQMSQPIAQACARGLFSPHATALQWLMMGSSRKFALRITFGTGTPSGGTFSFELGADGSALEQDQLLHLDEPLIAELHSLCAAYFPDTDSNAARSPFVSDVTLELHFHII